MTQTAEMTRHHAADEVERRMKEKGLNARSLSLAAGVGESYVRDLLRGRSKNPEVGGLKKLARVLGCTVEELYGHTPQPMGDDAVRAARFRAARWAWKEDAAKAAKALDVTQEEMFKAEHGVTVPIPEDLLLRFSALSDCPLGFLQHGDWSRVPGDMAARIGFFDPTLLPERREE